MEVKGRIRESSCNLKTSRELLRVLNRIQSIREQHASNMSAVKGLKVELDLSRGQIKELKRGKQMNSWQMKSLVKQMADDKFVRKNNAHDRLKVAVQSVEEDLEDERRSRRHSESLYWRPAQELSEVKSLFYGSLRELERERKARILLENLCDEFAIRIRDCEQESCSVKQNSVKNDEVGADGDNHGRLILDISEAWLDERMKMKVTKASDDLLGINSVVDKLGFDIETFLRAKRSVNLRKYENSSPKEVREIHPCQYNSLDSFPLQESISAPVNMHDDDDDDTNAENLGAAFGERHGIISSIDQEKKGSQISTGKQVQSKQIKTNTSHDDEERLFMERNSNDRTALINETEISTVCEEPVQVAQESDRSLIKILDSSHRISRSSTRHDRVNLENMRRGDSCVHSVDGSNVSPVNQRKLRFSKGVKEGTLKAKLLEARLDGHYSRFVAGNSSLG
ncbi:uncharacterized protein At5g41620-like [Neltuma alba]|uniref:uncharacterized protein At5g41620-like n=1 Tax=Neltuma alba TaxID=207710 RepID=UPI0010A40EC3|nr:uncharacterized protein At5g41620-like [Prosopis alba]